MMKALRYENNQINVSEIEKPLARKEAIVRVSLAGICNTDLEITRGYAGFQGTLGHEFVGTVESAVDSNLIGKRVVGEINAGCGKCSLCQSGDSRHCSHRTVLGIHGRDGALAEWLRLPAVNLLPVPENLIDERAVFTEPLAAACGILERVEIERDSRVAVIGDGKLGLLCAQVLNHAGARVLLIGKHKEKLQIAMRRDIETVTLEKTQQKRAFDIVVECSGSASGFTLALDLLRPQGTLVLKSTFHGAVEINAAPIVVDEISIVGSRCGRFAPALELLKENAIDVESLISEEYSLDQGVKAMKRAESKGILKVLVRPLITGLAPGPVVL